MLTTSTLDRIKKGRHRFSSEKQMAFAIVLILIGTEQKTRKIIIFKIVSLEIDILLLKLYKQRCTPFCLM